MGVWGPLITQLAPMVFAALAPIITSLLEVIGEKLGISVPKAGLPVVNYTSGVALASLAGGSPSVNPWVLPLGVIGAQVGNRVREAIAKGKANAKPS